MPKLLPPLISASCAKSRKSWCALLIFPKVEGSEESFGALRGGCAPRTGDSVEMLLVDDAEFRVVDTCGTFCLVHGVEVEVKISINTSNFFNQSVYVFFIHLSKG